MSPCWDRCWCNRKAIGFCMLASFSAYWRIVSSLSVCIAVRRSFRNRSPTTVLRTLCWLEFLLTTPALIIQILLRVLLQCVEGFRHLAKSMASCFGKELSFYSMGLLAKYWRAPLTTVRRFWPSSCAACRMTRGSSATSPSILSCRWIPTGLQNGEQVRAPQRYLGKMSAMTLSSCTCLSVVKHSFLSYVCHLNAIQNTRAIDSSAKPCSSSTAFHENKSDGEFVAFWGRSGGLADAFVLGHFRV